MLMLKLRHYHYLSLRIVAYCEPQSGASLDTALAKMFPEALVSDYSGVFRQETLNQIFEFGIMHRLGNVGIAPGA